MEHKKKEAGTEVLKQPLIMSIKKTGIALWRGSGFLLRTLKKKNTVFCPSPFSSLHTHNREEEWFCPSLFF